MVLKEKVKFGQFIYNGCGICVDTFDGFKVESIIVNCNGRGISVTAGVCRSIF